MQLLEMLSACKLDGPKSITARAIDNKIESALRMCIERQSRDNNLGEVLKLWLPLGNGKALTFFKAFCLARQITISISRIERRVNSNFVAESPKGET